MKSNIKKVIIGILLLVVFVMAVKVIIDKCHLKQGEQRFYDRFNQIPENPDPEDAIGLSLANISSNEEKEIQEVIKKAFEGQYLYRFCHKDEKEMDGLIENLYIPKEYQQFKKEFKKEYEVWCGMNLEDTISSLEKIRFSKIGKYKDLDDRIGVAAEPEFGNVHFFLFKKVNNQWEIEKEKWPMIKYSFDEHLAAKQLLEQKNNETPEAEIMAYLEAIKQNDKTKALEIWQLSEEEKNINSNYSFLKNRREKITEELIEKNINNFEIINIEWRSVNTYNIQKGGYILKDYNSCLADGARIEVQITDFNNNKLNYIFDIFTEGIYPEKTERDYSSLKNWILRDVYLENEESLFWVAKKER